MFEWLRRMLVQFFGRSNRPAGVNYALTVAEESRREREHRRPVIDRARLLADAYMRAEGALKRR